MKQNFWWLAGALSGIAIVLIVFLIKRVTRGKDKDFDERQTAARGKAFQYAFFTTALGELFYVCLEAGGIVFADTSIGPLLPVILGLAVFAVTAVANDAYLSLRESPRSAFLFPLIILAINLLAGIPKLLNGEVFVDGILTFGGLNLVMAALFAVLLAAVVIHWFRGRRGEGAEGEEDGGDSE